MSQVRARDVVRLVHVRTGRDVVRTDSSSTTLRGNQENTPASWSPYFRSRNPGRFSITEELANAQWKLIVSPDQDTWNHWSQPLKMNGEGGGIRLTMVALDSGNVYGDKLHCNSRESVDWEARPVRVLTHKFAAAAAAAAATGAAACLCLQTAASSRLAR